MTSLVMDGLVCMYCKRRYNTKHCEKYHYHIRRHRKRYYGRNSLYSQWFVTRDRSSKLNSRKVSQKKTGYQAATDKPRKLRQKKKRKTDPEFSEFKVSTYGTQKWYFLKRNKVDSSNSGDQNSVPYVKGKGRRKTHPLRHDFGAASGDTDYVDLSFHKEPTRTRPTDWQHVRQWRHFWDEQLKLPSKTSKRKPKPCKPESVPVVITIDDDEDDDDVSKDASQEQNQIHIARDNNLQQNAVQDLSYVHAQQEMSEFEGRSVLLPSEHHASDNTTGLSSVIEMAVYKCQYCGTMAEGEDDLAEHEGTHTGNMPYLCIICNARFAVITNFRAHERAHFADIAKETGETAELERDSNSVNKLNSGPLILSVPPPGKRGRKARDEEATYKCDYCGIVKRERRALEEHIRIHTGERPLTCKYCSMTFSHRGSRNKHERRHEKKAGTYDQSTQCKFCNMTMSDKKDLRNHIRDCHGEAKPFKCRFCAKCFSHKCNLESHERVHTGEKPFTCPMCPAAFTQLSQQLTHIRTHTGEKPYNCHFCEKTFRTSSVRKNHERTHTGEKPYHCTFCSATFARRTNMKQHLISHTDIKPKQCQYCGKGLTSNRSLKRHEEGHRRKEQEHVNDI